MGYTATEPTEQMQPNAAKPRLREVCLDSLEELEENRLGGITSLDKLTNQGLHHRVPSVVGDRCEQSRYHCA